MTGDILEGDLKYELSEDDKKECALINMSNDERINIIVRKRGLAEIIDSNMDRFRQKVPSPDLDAFKKYSVRTKKIQRQIYRELEGHYSGNALTKWSQRAINEFLSLLRKKSEPLHKLYSIQKENLGGAHYILAEIYSELNKNDCNIEEFCHMGHVSQEKMLREGRQRKEELKRCKNELNKITAEMNKFTPKTEGYYALRDILWKTENRIRRLNSKLILCEDQFFQVESTVSRGYHMGNSLGVSANLVGRLRNRYLISYNVLHKLLPTITYTQKLASQGTDAFELSAVMHQTLNQAFYLEDKHLPTPQLLSGTDYIDAEFIETGE